MSPRAAWRLESLGFENVYDYEAGKADWLGAGLPSEGRLSKEPRIGPLARRGVPTCRLDETVDAVAKRLEGWDRCVVVNDENVVLGLVRSFEGDARAEEVMESGPSTFRPSVSVEEMLGYMKPRKMTRALVTTSDGRLVGYFFRDGL